MGSTTLRVAALLTAISLAASAAEPDGGAAVRYVGGTSPLFQGAGRGVLTLTDEDGLCFWAKSGAVKIPYSRINLIEYGQKAERRVGLAMALSALTIVGPLVLMTKSRQHFLTLGFRDENGQQQAVVFRVDKKGIRPVLVGLEAKTGLRVEYQDEAARLSGKG